MNTKILLQKYRKVPVQVKASFWFLVCAFLQRAITSITTPIFTRILTNSEYGEYNMFNSWMGIITCFVSLNIYGGVYTQGLVKHEEDRDKYVASYEGLLISLIVGATVIYSIFQKQLNSLLSLNNITGYMMLIIIWSTGIFQLWAQQQRTQFKYKQLVLVTLLHSVLSPTLSIILIKNSEDKATARIIGIAVTGLITHLWMCIQHIHKGKVFFSWKVWKSALKLSIPLIPHYLSQRVLNSSDRIMIGRMIGTSEAGIYSLAYNVSLIMTIFNTSMLSTIEPWIYQKIKARQINILRTVAYPAFIAIAFVNLALIGFAPEIVRLFAPIEYYEAIWVIPPVAMSVFFMFMYSFFALFEFYFENTKSITVATMTGAIVNVLLNYIFINKFGYLAAAYTTLVCYIIYVFMHYISMKRICNKELNGEMPYSLKVIILISLLFVACGFAIMLTYRRPIIRFSIIAIALIVIIIKRNSIKKHVLTFLSLRKKNN